MKKRKGFAFININGNKFLFNWARTEHGPMLVLYTIHNFKIEIPYHVWERYPDSDEYTSGLHVDKLGRKFETWHGKHKKGAEWGIWGKRQAREMYFKYLKYVEECGVLLS
jgi:hypothetical protein